MRVQESQNFKVNQPKLNNKGEGGHLAKFQGYQLLVNFLFLSLGHWLTLRMIRIMKMKKRNDAENVTLVFGFGGLVDGWVGGMKLEVRD